MCYPHPLRQWSGDLNGQRRSRFQLGRERRGAAAVFGVILTLSLIVLTAVTIDFANIHVGETELQRCADATAMAACWELYDQQLANQSPSGYAVNAAANEFAALNTIGGDPPHCNSDDVELGTYGVDGTWSTAGSSYNAVRVTLRRQSGNNGELPLFFGSLTGRDSQSLHTTATAAMFSAISGFHEPGEASETVEMLPIALDLPTWLAAEAAATEDDYAFVNGTVQRGSDGICECNLYPKGTGAPGNRGTVDIGGADNSTQDIARQVIHGISKQDFIELGKPLAFDANGKLDLNGDTGISAGIKDELASLIGKKRIIPIFENVVLNGNTAMFTIVRLEGVRILDVKLTGKKSHKRVIVQPEKMIARGAKIDWTGTYNSTHLVTPVMLVQ